MLNYVTNKCLLRSTLFSDLIELVNSNLSKFRLIELVNSNSKLVKLKYTFKREDSKCKLMLLKY